MAVNDPAGFQANLNALLTPRKFEIGDDCMIYGVDSEPGRNEPAHGKVIDIVEIKTHGRQYVVEIPTGIEPLLFLRTGVMDMVPYTPPPPPDPKQEAFDKMCADFTEKVYQAADWREGFLGAVYSTRIKAAIALLREAIAEAEKNPEIGGT